MNELWPSKDVLLEITNTGLTADNVDANGPHIASYNSNFAGLNILVLNITFCCFVRHILPSLTANALKNLNP